MTPNVESLELRATTEPFEQVIAMLLTVLEAKDLKLRRHAERVAKYAVQIGEQVELSPARRDHLYFGALLHDIGNVSIPDAILNKPGGLSRVEFDEMKLHTIIGEQICKPLRAIEVLRPLIRCHHEKLDGSGYPNGLKGDEIPLLVKILSVADVYDSLRSERAYRSAFGHEQAVEILKEEVTRGWWDAEVVELLANVIAPEGDFAPV